MHVPFVVRWPGKLPAGKVYDRTLIQLDVQPTALAAAGIDVKPEWKLDGVNLLPHLQGETSAAPTTRSIGVSASNGPAVMAIGNWFAMTPWPTTAAAHCLAGAALTLPTILARRIGLWQQADRVQEMTGSGRLECELVPHYGSREHGRGATSQWRESPPTSGAGRFRAL